MGVQGEVDVLEGGCVLLNRMNLDGDAYQCGNGFGDGRLPVDMTGNPDVAKHGCRSGLLNVLPARLAGQDHARRLGVGLGNLNVNTDPPAQ